MQPLTLAIAALVAIVVAALFSRRTGVATPLILLVIGFAVSLTPAVPEVDLEPDWILVIVLPPLLYASAVRVPVIDLRRNLRWIFALSVVLVIASALAVGALVHWIVPEIPFAAGVALGAVVSPTDAVAATSIGKRLGLPHRLMTVLEGESLLNDASALVLLRTALAAVAGAFSLGDAVADFARAVLVAVVVGLVVGYLTARLRARLHDPVLTTAVSFVVPFLAFLPAEEFEASGVVSVVVAGLVTGSVGARRFSARERSTERTNWATLQFLIENGVFLLMGLQLHAQLTDMQENHASLQLGLVIVGLVLVVLLVLRSAAIALELVAERRRGHRRDARRARVDRAEETVRTRADEVEDRAAKEQTTGWDERYERHLGSFRRRIARGRADMDYYDREPIGTSGGIVATWAGMRGVVTLAAALSIDHDVPGRSLLIGVAFGVAVLSLLLYGGTLPLLIRRLGLGEHAADDSRAELAELMDELSTSALDSIVSSGPLQIGGQEVDAAVVERVSQRYQRLREMTSHEPGRPEALTEREQVVLVARVYLGALREALHEQRTIGAYPTTVFARAEELLDAEELRLDR